jgi:Holliday junction resolvase RusA-like endonuclease
MHFMRRSKYFQSWIQEIRAQIPYAGTPEPGSKCLIAIHQVRTRLLDPDNLVASCKPILDAIVHWGLVFEDDPEHIEIEVTQAKGKPRQTTIRIENLSAIGYCQTCKSNIFTTYSEHNQQKHMRGPCTLAR